MIGGIMKRDERVIYRILKKIEEESNIEQFDNYESISLSFDDIDQDIVKYHLILLTDTNLVDFYLFDNKRNPDRPKRLTLSGHDYLDHLREKYSHNGKSGIY